MVEFRMFGALSLTTDSGRDARSLVTQPRRLALLAYLAAARPRGTHRRDSLLALFWPELDQPLPRAPWSSNVWREAISPPPRSGPGERHGWPPSMKPCYAS